MKKSGLHMMAVTVAAVTMMFATPLVSWAEQAVEVETISPVILAEAEEGAIEEAVAAHEAGAITEVVEETEAVEDDQTARQELVDYALQFVGNPYRTGGSDPNTGADCSGFVKYVMEHGAGISMNRSSRSQATQGQQISAEEMQPGDLIFYGNGSRINHVAMYIGDGQVVHASTHKTGIKTSAWNYRSPVKIVNMMG